MTREEFLNLKEGDECVIIVSNSSYFNAGEIVKFHSHHYMNNDYGRFINDKHADLMYYYEVKKVNKNEQ